MLMDAAPVAALYHAMKSAEIATDMDVEKAAPRLKPILEPRPATRAKLLCRPKHSWQRGRKPHEDTDFQDGWRKVVGRMADHVTAKTM
jgi:hypothetical protein